jgi:hypothetical protein
MFPLNERSIVAGVGGVGGGSMVLSRGVVEVSMLQDLVRI